MYTVYEIRKAYQECHRDILQYKASKVVGSAKSLIYERLNLLGNQLGQDLDYKKLEEERRSKRQADYEAYLLSEYNLSREEAAKLMNEAMSRESSGFSRGRQHGKR